MTTGPVRFYKIYPSIPPICHADASANGTMYAEAFRYCEAMRVASSFGWYAYPPEDISLTLVDGAVYIFIEDEWVLLKSHTLNPRLEQEWEEAAPSEFASMMPPFVRALPFPGVVQIFTGHFVETPPGWSINVRAPVNIASRPWQQFEGIVETDQFRPCPLFANIRLTTSDREVFISSQEPFLQLQPVFQQSYRSLQKNADVVEVDGTEPGQFPWERLPDTLHTQAHSEEKRLGRYAIGTRKRNKAVPPAT